MDFMPLTAVKAHSYLQRFDIKNIRPSIFVFFFMIDRGVAGYCAIHRIKTAAKIFRSASGVIASSSK